jgi:hypothetical protein
LFRQHSRNLTPFDKKNLCLALPALSEQEVGTARLEEIVTAYRDASMPSSQASALSPFLARTT